VRIPRRRIWSPKKCGDAGTTVELEGFSAIQSTPGKLKAADAAGFDDSRRR